MRKMIRGLDAIAQTCMALAVAATGCRYQPPPPDQPLLTWVTNSFEYSTDPGSWAILTNKIDDIHKVTNSAFGQVARINFNFPSAPGSTVLSNGGQGWPILDRNDPNYVNDGSSERFYGSFIQNTRNTNSAFGVFWVLGPNSSFPICGTQPKVLGFTYDATLYADNQVPGAASNRGSVVFTGWIDGITQCQWYTGAGYPAINLYIRVLTHEMGHQRADLTHSDEFPYYHTGPVPVPSSGTFDVMYSNALASSLRIKTPVFDQHFDLATEQTPCLTLTCQDNLICWRSITN